MSKLAWFEMFKFCGEILEREDSSDDIKAWAAITWVEAFGKIVDFIPPPPLLEGVNKVVFSKN